MNVLPLGAGAVSLKVAATKPKLFAKLNAHDVPVEFKIINRQAAAHVLKVRFQFYVRSSDQAQDPSGEWTFYRELAYDNQGLGWKLTPYQSLELTLRAFLNDEDRNFRVKQLLERRARGRSSTAKHYGHLRLRILADVDKLAVAPHDWVDIYLDR